MTFTSCPKDRTQSKAGQTKTLNTELNDWSIIIYLRKSEVTVEKKISVTEKLMEHGIYCLQCSYTNDIIDTIATMTSD